MNPRPSGPLVTPDAWLGRDLQAQTSWIHDLSAPDVDELVASARAARDRFGERWKWRREDFELPTMAPRVAGWLDALDHGRGFVLIRGFPVDAHDEATCSDIYWGLGLHLGRAISQNTDGDLLGHVRDVGADPNAYGVRLYKTRAEQDFHTDGADIIGLFCLRSAKSGGVSRIASSPAIYNRMLAERPDLIPTLFENFPFDTQGQHKPGGQPWFDRPICTFDGTRLNTFFIPWYIRESQMHAQAPRLSDAQAEVIAFVERTANDPDHYLDMDFRPGDMQFLKNAAGLHKRTAYEDWPEADRKRHLLRLWLVAEQFTAGDARLRRGIG